ncbi:MAG: LysR family transcriptional regulator [Pigmentiphaga sp.]|uniref:LysR family transcriptional regulator n=1 Tax=Pigmentiphaga sp. TaxID=1977564 RepID=UPI0029BDFB71|nr:LysR family transcriptional regulator [Pigmentiphaga sp.]MDX3906333.1 LysR family transcriptional regulator [Pigmentiphaga sp.]
MSTINDIDVLAGKIDLNLLRVFIAVMQERSITTAGARLGLTQSATSAAVNRLRQQLNDQLFVRTRQGMEPTSLAMSLSAPVENALGLLRDALRESRGFDAGSTVREFRLLMTDVGKLMFLPRLTAWVHEHAPGVRLSCRQVPRDQYGAELETGGADLALGMLPLGERDFVQQRLKDETLVCLGSSRNPVLRKRLTMEAFLSVPHVVIRAPAMGDRFVVKALGERASRRKIVAEVQHYLSVPMILRDSLFLAVVSTSVAEALAAPNQLAAISLIYFLLSCEHLYGSPTEVILSLPRKWRRLPCVRQQLQQLSALWLCYFGGDRGPELGSHDCCHLIAP